MTSRSHIVATQFVLLKLLETVNFHIEMVRRKL